MCELVSILLVDDHPSVALGTKLMLEKEIDFEVTALNSGEEALNLILEKKFDVFIFDLKMPEMNGHELAKKVIEINSDAKIIIYTGYEIEPYFNELILSGVLSFLSKTDTQEQMIKTIRSLLNNNATIPVHLLQQLRKGNLQSKSIIKNPLNPEEENILEQVAVGKTNKEIANSIFKSTRTVEYHLTTIFKKLNVRSRIEAVEKVRELEW